MKKHIKEFIRRGLVACGLGPLVLAALYLILAGRGVIGTLTVQEVSLGIFSLAGLAFVAGGMNVVYQMERLPLLVAVTLHGGVLYLCYLATYLVNGWLQWGTAPMLVFSGIFLFGYLAIWLVISAVTKRRTARLNEMLRQTQDKNKAPLG